MESPNRKVHSDESKKKASESLKKYFAENPTKGKVKEIRQCVVCNKSFEHFKHKKKMTCSKKCFHETLSRRAMDSDHKWGKCLAIPYQLKSGEIINLQSNWEVNIAELLDEMSISWIRPEPIPWTDATGKNRLYYPDFLLTQTNTYLDPKNARVMARDVEKITEVSKAINLIVGDLKKVRNFVVSQLS